MVSNNTLGNIKTVAFSKVESAIKKGKTYVTGAYDKTKKNIVTLLKGIDNYRAIYKVMVSYPVYKNGELHVQSVVVADTSTSTFTDILKKKIGFGVSEIVGMWVDTSDSEDPDKCSIIFKTDPDLSVKSVRGEASILDDEYFMFSEVFAMNNWVDIWMGYQKIGDTNLISENIVPDNFEWGSETHLFSGRIVLVDRNWDINGDRMMVSAYSAEEILFNHTTYVSNSSPRTLKISNRETNNADKLRPLKEGLRDIFKSIISMSDWIEQEDQRRQQQSQTGTTNQSPNNVVDFNFVVGDFYWKMIEKGVFDILDMLEEGAQSKHTKVGYGYEYPVLDKYINTKIFSEDPTFKMKAPLVLTGKNITLWKAIKLILAPEYSNASGIGFRVYKSRDFKDDVTNVGQLTPNEGTDKHIGVRFKFFYELDVDEITEIVDVLKNKKGYNKLVPPEEIQQITFGLDIIDFEAYMDYNSSFNSFPIMTPTYKRSNQVKPDYKGGKEFIFPLDHKDLIADLISSNDTSAVGEFWDSVLRDIRVFGERRFPVTKWFSYSPDDIEQLRKSITTASILRTLEGKTDESIVTEPTNTAIVNEEILRLLVNPELDLKSIVGHKGIAHMFKRYYFGGLEGSALIVGNPSLKAHRVLEVRDITYGLQIGISAGFKRDPQNLAESIYDKIKLNFRNKISGDLKPIDLATKFDPDYIKKYFIWKTRHYYGISSGYITKVYFTQSRAKAWRMVDRGIMGTLKQVQRIRDEMI